MVCPTDRLTAAQTMEHVWFAEADDKVLPDFGKEMRKYNARRRWKKSLHKVKIVNTMKDLFDGPK